MAMQRTPSTRKRGAPASSPMMPQSVGPQNTFDYSQIAHNTDFNNFDFSTQYPVDQTYQDQTFNDTNLFASNLNSTQPPTYSSNVPTTPSTDLVRRARNQQLAPQPGQEQWIGYNNVSGRGDEEDEQELERKVALAKKDAQGKRKQIPPFVQKLSSFLDSGNTDLIRWSDDGRSFIVIDEDEFARTLIPELFKHNNYASFVRQLNMYGFHKTVNITDGSLRQSEKARKGVKPPSMYSHPYFRRNRPDLLWLIQKPTAKTGAKRKRDGTVKADETDDERSFSPIPDSKPPGEVGIAAPGHDLATLPKNELGSVRRELHKLQQQQKFISEMIAQLKQQNESFYQQATAFQNLHNRHENSINAILTFLATFYNRSLDGHAGQNVVNMFSNMNQGAAQQHGSVVEDFGDAVPENSNPVPRYKRPPLLLTGPTGTTSVLPNQPASAHNTAPSSRSPNTPADGHRPSSMRQPSFHNKPAVSSSASPQVKNDAPTPNMLGSLPESDQMMSLINSVNATNASTPIDNTSTSAPAFDFSSALDHYQNANGHAPLTPQQRDDMLTLMANQQGNNSGNNNAMISPTPPPMPDLNQLKETQQQLDMLTNMQKSQDKQVAELNRRLQPLSPGGVIPGVPEAGGGGNGGSMSYFDPTGAPGDFNPDDWINNDNNGLGFNFTDDANDGQVDWSFDNSAGDVNGGDMFGGGAGAGRGYDAGAGASAGYGTGGGFVQDDNGMLQPEQFDGGGRVESVSSSATSPAGTVGEDGGELGSERKRRRRSGD